MSSLIQIDGSMLEGGGQLLRVAVALSGVTGKPIQVDRIRVKREKPGLRRQHLSAVKAVADLVGAQVSGLEIGSQSITFRPGQVTAKDLRIDVGTAGSTTLILQALMPALAFAPACVRVALTGGTNNPLAPSIDYMSHVLMPALRQMDFQCEAELARRGFYPKGGGLVRVVSKPAHTLRPLNLTESEDPIIRILAYSCKLPSHITERMVKTASEILRKHKYSELKTEAEALQEGDARCSIDPGCGLLVAAEHASGLIAGFDALGEKGKPAEKVAEEVVSSVLTHLGRQAPVEPHLCDQLIVWISLAEGRSEIRTSELTLHSLTCVAIARRLLGVEFEVEGGLGEPATIRCSGVSLRNKTMEGSMQGVI